MKNLYVQYVVMFTKEKQHLQNVHSAMLELINLKR